MGSLRPIADSKERVATTSLDLQNLGSGIWLSLKADNPPTRKIGDSIHYRFLDRLFIPTSTNELSIEQIALINRFRESSIGIDQQFEYCARIRRLFERCFRQLDFKTVMEIGPGKFPLLCPTFQHYSCLDIDNDAVRFLQDGGHDAISVEQFLRRHSQIQNYELCFALFVFHFKVDPTLISQMAKNLARNGVIVFNVVSHNAAVRKALFSALSSVGFSAKGIDLQPVFGKDDMIFVCSRDNEAARTIQIFETFIENIKNR
jgi:hypothetical protein